MELLKSVRLLSNVLFFRLKYGDPGKVDRHWENYWKTIRKTGRGGWGPVSSTWYASSRRRQCSV